MAATMLILVPLLASTLARAEIPRSASDLARDGTSKQNATMALIGVCWRLLAFVGVQANWKVLDLCAATLTDFFCPFVNPSHKKGAIGPFYTFR